MKQYSISKKIKKGIRWQVLTNIIGQAVYFVNGVILARILSPSEFGVFGMTQVISSFVFMFWNLGINAAIIQKKEITHGDLHTAFTLSIFMGFTVFCLIFISSPYIAIFFKETIVKPITILVGSTFIIYSFDRIPSALLGRNLYFKHTSLINLINPIVYSLISIPLAINGYGVYSFAYGIIGGALSMMILKIYISNKLFDWRPKFRIYKQSIKNLLGFGTYLTLQSLLNFVTSNLQRIITGRYLGATDLGYFNRASNLSNIPISKINENIGGVLLPAFSSIQNNKEKIRDWFLKFNFFTYCSIAPVLIFFIYFPNEIIVGVFGEKWSPSTIILYWFSLTALFSVSDLYFNNILNSISKPHINFYIRLFTIIPFIISIAISFKWGLLGITIALFINTVFLFLVYLLVFQFYQLFSIKDYVISSTEPISVSIVAGYITKFLYLPICTFTKSAEIKIILISSIFFLNIFLYYLFRWFKKSNISYLGFDLKSIINF